MAMCAQIPAHFYLRTPRLCEHTDETCEYEENVEDLEDDQPQVVKCERVKV